MKKCIRSVYETDTATLLSLLGNYLKGVSSCDGRDGRNYIVSVDEGLNLLEVVRFPSTDLSSIIHSKHHEEISQDMQQAGF